MYVPRKQSGNIRNTPPPLSLGKVMLLHMSTAVEQGTAVSGKILSLETDLNSLFTLESVVFFMLKITSGLRNKLFLRNRPPENQNHVWWY